MKRAKKAKKNIDFLLENKHYKRLNIILYLVSVLIIVGVYFITLLIFSKFVNMTITAITSFIVGLYIVIHRASIIKKVSDHLENKKRNKYKKESQQNLKSTLNSIRPKPKRNIKLNIKPKFSIKEGAKNFSSKLRGKKKPQRKGYIEVK